MTGWAPLNVDHMVGRGLTTWCRNHGRATLGEPRRSPGWRNDRQAVLIHDRLRFEGTAMGGLNLSTPRAGEFRQAASARSGVPRVRNERSACRTSPRRLHHRGRAKHRRSPARRSPSASVEASMQLLTAARALASPSAGSASCEKVALQRCREGRARRVRRTARAASPSRPSARSTSRHITLPQPSQIALSGASR